MKLRFGYVSNALSLWDCSPAKTMTYARHQKLDEGERLEALRRVTKQNLEHTLRIIHYNIAHEIHLYRFSSSLVPLATHPDASWDFIKPFRDEFQKIGDLVKENRMRTSFHPNQFTLFTSDRAAITENSVRDMEYHYDMLKAMGLEQEGLINLHVGGAYGDKKASAERFFDNIQSLSPDVYSRMTLENDDKTYTAAETLQVCEKGDIPLMFDYHHYQANKNEGEEQLEDLLPRFFQTWKRVGLAPKIHISSPKTEKEYRSHADFVDLEFIMPLLKMLKEFDVDADMMIEAKQKDLALFKLVGEIAGIRGVKRVDGGSVVW
ncbi:UV DNA damage repair endonuclease UvsE [Metabacillus sp. 113a]|uniref:UV DNA damage repair endonuclease UvsE n=1 Tax=Metabacillus sp. 113a TaxID=3404706 RepID=UPI003CEB8739